MCLPHVAHRVCLIAVHLPVAGVPGST